MSVFQRPAVLKFLVIFRDSAKVMCVPDKEYPVVYETANYFFIFDDHGERFGIAKFYENNLYCVRRTV